MQCDWGYVTPIVSSLQTHWNVRLPTASRTLDNDRRPANVDFPGFTRTGSGSQQQRSKWLCPKNKCAQIALYKNRLQGEQTHKQLSRTYNTMRWRLIFIVQIIHKTALSALRGIAQHAYLCPKQTL